MENPIRYQDLISPDDSITKLIEQLEQLNTSYTNMANSVRQQAADLSANLKKVSGATAEGRKAISEQSEEAKRLERAYKQLDAALASNAKEIAKLNVLRRDANNYNKNLILRGKEEIKTREQIKNASYQQLSAQYSLNKAYINSLSAVERNTKANREYIKTTKEIYEQMKKLQADTGKMQLNVGNYPMLGGLLGGMGGKALGLGGAAAAGMALAGVIKDNVSLATEYEKSLSVLAAILGTTKEGIQDLSEQAQNLGATTVYTAREVAELQTELAKLGYSTKEIMNMAPSVLDFAQATGSSLADAASLAGAALRMFEKDTTHTTEFIDKMSAATTKSALNFSFLNNAMSTVAPVANAFGFKIEEVLALLGQLANAGFDASSAATATRNILLKLADANGKLATALGQPVTNLDDLIKGLVSLKDRGIDLGEALELTDKRSVAAFNTFLSGTDNVIHLRDELVSADGWAHKMAETMGDNMEGSLKSLDSAWQGLNLHINQSNGLLRRFVDWLTEAIRWVDKLGQKLDDWFFSDKSGDAVFSKMADDYEKGQQKMADADKKRADKNKAAGQWQAGVANGGITASGGSKGSGSGKSSAKEQKAAQAAAKRAQAAAKRALMEQKKQQKQSLDLRRKYEDAMTEIIDDEQSREWAKTSLQYERKIEDLRLQLEKEKTLTVDDRKVINDTIIALEEQKQMKLADITEKYAKKDKEAKEKKQKEALQNQQTSMREREKAIETQYDIDMEEIEQIDTSEKEKTRMRLEAEKKRLQALLALYEADGTKLKDKEVELIRKQIEGVDKELTKNKKSGDIYDMLGFKLTDEQKDAIDESLSYAINSLQQFMASYVEAAEKKKELANAAVESAQNVLEKEIEARNNGYANDVETARKELELARKNQRKAVEDARKAQQAQEMIDTATQASSLVTASANLWKTLSAIPYVGTALAIAAIATMWGSFAASKIKARQVSGMNGTEEYGEGTVELLQGGSHQSGNDIDLGRKRNGTRRRAEGGEFFAVINKRSSRRYRSIIPDVVNSLNNGTFAEKYMTAYNGGDIAVYQDRQTDLTRLQDDVRLIREQGEQERYVDGNGNTVMKYKNLRRIIRR